MMPVSEAKVVCAEAAGASNAMRSTPVTQRQSLMPGPPDRAGRYQSGPAQSTDGHLADGHVAILQLGQPPVGSLNRQGRDIARSRLEGVERPSAHTYARRRVVGGQRNRKTVHRYRETSPTGFEVCLLLRPTTK